MGTKKGEASHVRRSDRLLKPQLRRALHFVHCAARLYLLRHNQQNHGTNNRRLQRLSRPTWRLTRRSKHVGVNLRIWWVSTYCGAAVTFSGHSAKRGRQPGSATLHGQSAVSCFLLDCESRHRLSSSKTPTRGTRVLFTRLRTRFSLRAYTCGN